ncbi:MAG: PepSY-associated TM helix domain-containing protein, partial [Myxococcota bacterium]
MNHWRSRLLTLHRWLGVTLGLYLLVICLSGSLAVFGHELDALLGPAYPATTGAVQWDAVDASLAERFRYGVVNGLWLEPDTGQLWLSGETAHGQLVRVWLDPQTGAVLDERNYVDIKYFLRQFHKTLLMPKGLYLVTPSALVLLYGVVSGLLVVPFRWRDLFRLRLRRGRLVAYADVHRTIGLWAVALGLIIAVTGVWYLAEVSARDLGATVEPERPQLVTPYEGPRAPLTAIVASARAALPDLRIERVLLGDRPTDPVWVTGHRSAWLVRARANRVYLHPRDASVIDVWHEEDQTVLHRWSDMADPLHFGTFGGLASKALWFAFGLVLCVAVFAGPWLARARARGRRRRSRWYGWALAVSALTALVLVGCAVLSVLGQRLTIIAGRPVPDAVAEVDGGVIVRRDDGPTSTYRLLAQRAPASALTLAIGPEAWPLSPGKPVAAPRADVITIRSHAGEWTAALAAPDPARATQRALTIPPRPIPAYVQWFV